MGRRSFRDAATGVLKAHGFVARNEAADIAQEEPDDFSLEPGRWRWDGTQWVPFTPPVPTPDEEAGRDAQRAPIQATLAWVLGRLLNRPPSPAELQAARQEWIAARKEAAPEREGPGIEFDVGAPEVQPPPRIEFDVGRPEVQPQPQR
jgi:hypothetical protein